MEAGTRLNSPGSHQKPVVKERLSSQTKRKRRLRRTVVSSSSSSDEDEWIHKSLQTKAARSHLTSANVRNIIKDVVTNKQVLAAVQSRAEEMTRQIEEQIERMKEQVLAWSPSDQKMTRNRAKELNHTPLKILDLHTQDKCITQLVRTDLMDDDDDTAWDAEYVPNYDEESDDCSTATCSDVESQARTQSESEQEIVYDLEESVFKRPQGVPIQKPKAEVAKRTRSKLNLEGTEVEAIQAHFQPPDLPIDVPKEHDFGWDADAPWLEFLDQFQKPLAVLAEAEEGEETDPEFVFTEAMDKAIETNNSVVVSKHESERLMRGLLEEIEENINDELHQELMKGCREPIPLPPVYHPPATTIEESPNDHLSACAAEPPAPPPPLILFPPAEGVESLAIIVPTPSLPLHFNLIQGSDQNLFLMPTMTQCTEPPKSKTAFLEVNVTEDMDTIISRINEQRLLNYNQMILESAEIGGWTLRSMRIFHRQLLTHVQLLGQMFVQTCFHPALWKTAYEFKDILNDLNEQSSSSRILRSLCWNLADMQQVCAQWESDLGVDSEETQEYLEGLMEWSFHKRVMDCFLNNRGFVYPQHLPRVPVTEKRRFTSNAPSRAILFLLELKSQNCRAKGSVFRRCVHEFQRKYKVEKGPRTFYGLLRRNSYLQNYIETGTVPVIEAKECALESYEEAVPLAEQPAELLSGEWAEYLREKEGRQCDREWQAVVQDKEGPKKKKKALKRKRPEEEESPPSTDTPRPTNITMNFLEFTAQFQLPGGAVYYGVGDDVPESVGEEEEEEDIDGDDIQMECDLSNDRVMVEHEEVTGGGRRKRSRTLNDPRKNNDLIKMIKGALRRQPPTQLEKKRNPLTRIRMRKRLTQKLQRLLYNFERNYDKNMDTFDPNLISTKLFHYFKEFDMFIRIFYLRTRSGPLRSTNPARREIEGPSIVREYEDLPSKPTNTRHEKDVLFAWKFLEAVNQETTKERFALFLDVLRESNRSYLPDFYLKIEELLLPEFPELLKIFLVHLLPNHVSQIGKFLQELISEDAAEFKENIEMYMEERRSQMEDIYDLLNCLAEEDTEMLTIKQRFLMVLSERSLMRIWFLKLFPTERSATAAEDAHAGLLQFGHQGSQVFLPSDLNSLIELMDQTEMTQMNLFLSDSEDSQDDSVECTGVETLKSPDYITYSIHSQESVVSMSDCDNVAHVYPPDKSLRLPDIDQNDSKNKVDCTFSL